MRKLIPIAAVACVCATFFQPKPSVAAPAVAARTCSLRAWVNAFEPNKGVVPKPTDKCPANEGQPVFTREGTLACPSIDAFSAASNAMDRGWHLTPTAGVVMKSSDINKKVGPDYFGCTIQHDGVSVTIQAVDFSHAQTPIGWVSRDNLRN